MANSKRKCGYCGERKLATTMVIKGAQAFCSNDHWIENQVKNKDKLVKKGQKIQRAEIRKKKEALRSLTWYKDNAQKWVNKFIRLRDKDKPCISCGRIIGKVGYIGSGNLHAGHYRSRGACSTLRYHEDNIHGQCAQCNEQKSGNAIDYRIELINRIGIDRVEWLERQPKSYKWTREEVEAIAEEYKGKCRELERESA